MSYKHTIIKERFDLNIPTSDGVFKAEFELDKNAKFLIGIALTSDRDDLLFYRGSQKILLNEIELFPDGFESKLLLSGLNVAPDNRMITLGELPTGNGKIDLSYTDTDHVMASFTAYRVTLYTFSTLEKAF
ncbi:MAG: hypothetical protein HYZ43_02490 [Flavobacteriia bacterium]|jgi:hypothetical protein|nr:hypothetical protein [Flavobacteriia bacterium]